MYQQPSFLLPVTLVLSYSPSKHHWEPRSPREHQCGGKELRIPDLRSLRHPPAFHNLAERWLAGQPWQFCENPLRYSQFGYPDYLVTFM